MGSQTDRQMDNRTGPCQTGAGECQGWAGAWGGTEKADVSTEPSAVLQPPPPPSLPDPAMWDRSNPAATAHAMGAVGPWGQWDPGSQHEWGGPILCRRHAGGCSAAQLGGSRAQQGHSRQCSGAQWGHGGEAGIRSAEGMQEGTAGQRECRQAIFGGSREVQCRLSRTQWDPAAPA